MVAAPVVDEALIAGDAEATLMGTPAPVSGEVSVISETDLSAAVTAPANAAKQSNSQLTLHYLHP